MKKRIHLFLAIAISTLAANFLFAGKGNSDQQGANFGALFYEGEIVGTVATPTAMPGRGVDTIYTVPGPYAAEGQLGITTVAPGDRGYHGGRWAVYLVTPKAPHTTVPLLTSEAEVVAAEALDLVEVTRAPENDFVCPVQKNGPKS